ncbi:glycosyltransferase family 2 protein [Vibrio breoganii]
MYYFSIVTATYNRSKLLPRLYTSLCNQGYKNFEWVIIDDGSFDNTTELIDTWISEKIINIKLIRQENQGKHRAINNGMKQCNSKWTAIIDSDDWIKDNTLESTKKHIEELRLDISKDVAGIIFNSLTSDEKTLGSKFPMYIHKGRTYEYYNRYNIIGDKFDFYKTEIIKSNPFPEIDAERFISEGVIWNRINAKYYSYFINEDYQYVEYQSEGLSDSSIKSRVESPIGSALVYYESSRLKMPIKKRARNLINYYRFKFHGGDFAISKPVVNLFIDMLAYFLGIIVFVKDKNKLKNY